VTWLLYSPNQKLLTLAHKGRLWLNKKRVLNSKKKKHAAVKLVHFKPAVAATLLKPPY
jgi:hypothetical protein